MSRSSAGEREEPPVPVAATSPDLLDTPEAGPAVIRGGTARTLGYVAGILLSTAATPLMIRHLGVVDFGRYVTVTSIITIVAAISDVGLTNIGVREYTLRPEDERRQLVRNLLGIRQVVAALTVALAVVFTVVAGYPSVVVAGTALAGLGLLIAIAQVTYQIPLSTSLRLGWITAIEFVKQLVTVIVIVALVVAGASLLPFYFVTIAAGIATLIFTLILVSGRVPILPAAHWHEWMRLVRDAPAYAVASAIGFIYFRIEVVLMSLISTDQQTGYFSASFRIVEIISGIPLLASLSVFPLLARAARDDRDRLRYMLDRLFQAYALAGLGVALAFIVGAPVAIHILAGNAFNPAIPVLRIMGASLAATFLVSIWGFALLAVRRHALLMVANLGALLLAVALTFALVPSHAARGAALALAITEVTLATTYAAALMGPGSHVRASFAKVPAMLIAFAAGLAVGLLSGLPAAVETVLALAAYAAVLFVLRAIPREAIDAFRPGGNGDAG